MAQNLLTGLKRLFRRNALKRKVMATDPLAAQVAEGLAHMHAGQTEDASACFESVILMQPDHAQAHHCLGILAAQSGDFFKATELIGHAAKLDPANAEISNNLGNALRQLGRIEQAREAYEQAIANDRTYPNAYLNHADLCLKSGDVDAALSSFDGFLALHPESAEVWNQRGMVLTECNRHEEAMESFGQAHTIAPQSVVFLINRGSALTQLRRFPEAIADFKQAIRSAPDNFLAYYNLGTVLFKNQMQPEQALPHFDEAIRLKPDYGSSYYNRANALDDLGRYTEAITDFERALHFGTEDEQTFGMLMYTRMRICDWSNYSVHCNDLVRRIEQGEMASVPFMMLAVSSALTVQRQIAELAAAHLHTTIPPLPPPPALPKHKRIRIAYFSADLRNHPVAFLTAELFELHDAEKFEVVVFSFGPYDEMTRRVNSAVEDYIDARTLTDIDVVNLARTLEIDIAIDLGGYTAHNRSAIFAMRVAPVQISYLGYPGTMGTAMHDYLIADRVLIPEEYEYGYAEKIIRLPVYQINDSKRKISPRQFTRAELGLPESGFVFCCFNNTVKFNPAMFDTWAAILQETPGSVLFLLAGSEEATANLFKEAEARGVNRARIVLGGRLPPPEYLARYRTCDLFLDTLPFNAGTTASDALWAGLPVLTCTGEAFASRMAASLLTALKLPELITDSLSGYQQQAIALARQPELLGVLRQRLAENVQQKLLFDTPSVTRHIEAAYAQAYTRWQQNLLPTTIEITN